jgi:hypothetical protein
MLHPEALLHKEHKVHDVKLNFVIPSEAKDLGHAYLTQYTEMFESLA